MSIGDRHAEFVEGFQVPGDGVFHHGDRLVTSLALGPEPRQVRHRGHVPTVVLFFDDHLESSLLVHGTIFPHPRPRDLFFFRNRSPAVTGHSRHAFFWENRLLVLEDQS